MIKKLLFEIHDYTAGEFHGFAIGEDKQAVLARVRAINADARITPIPREDFVVSTKNLGDLQYAKRSEGLRVFNYRGLWVDIYFDNDKVSGLSKSPATTLPFSFQVGDRKQEVVEYASGEDRG